MDVADHPWLVERAGGARVWVETINLAPGDRLVTQDADRLTFQSAAMHDGGTLTQTYNLTVAENHTFLVGEDGVVVHNSCNQMLRQILRGQAPRGITRVDRARVAGEKDHVHLNGGALNRDGTWKHAPNTPLTRDQQSWLQGWGWRLPE